MFPIRSTVHTTTQHTPSQLVFGRDVILNINQEANRQLIKQRIQALINKGNKKENVLDNPMCIALETKSYKITHGKQNSIKTHI